MTSAPGRTAPSDRPAGPGSSLPGFGRWARRSDVEQVRLYTVSSLHSVAWILLGCGALAAAARLGATGPAVVVVAVALVLGGLAWWVTSRATADVAQRLTVADLQLPLLAVAAVAVGLAAWAVGLGDETGFAVATLGVGALGWVSGALADSRAHVAAVVVGVVVSWIVTGNPFLTVYGAFVAGFLAFTMISSLWLLRIVTELDRARGTQAALAVAEERLRFSRDVHDVMGRHLSTIAVQSELAATLVRRGDARAADKVLEVRATAHDALREAREIARGYRPLDLDHELDGAVSLLRSAGIDARADLGELPEAWHEPAARVVREAVTNVLRHSDARTVRIGLDDGVLVVADDGSPRPAPAGDGTGLDAVRDALAPLGARLEAGPTDDGWRVRLHLAGASPRRTEEG